MCRLWEIIADLGHRFAQCFVGQDLVYQPGHFVFLVLAVFQMLFKQRFYFGDVLTYRPHCVLHRSPRRLPEPHVTNLLVLKRPKCDPPRSKRRPAGPHLSARWGSGGGQVGSGEGQDQKDQRKQCRLFGMVRPRGLEPPRVAPLAPQASASANSATAACGVDAHQRGGGVERSETRQGILARLTPACTKCCKSATPRGQIVPATPTVICRS